MKRFSERNPLIVGAIGVVCTVVAVNVALQYKHLPFVDSKKEYSAYFTEAGGLTPGSAVRVSGFEVGSVSSVSLEGAQVRVGFEVDKSVSLGDRTEAVIKTKSLLGNKILEVLPRGDAILSGPIPSSRTTPPYQLADALGDLAATIDQLNTGDLSQSLDTLAQTFADTPPELQAAVQGLGRFSQSLNNRDEHLRNLLANAKKTTQVLADRSDQVITLIRQTNSLLAQLRTESDSLDSISTNVSYLSKQLSGFVADTRGQLRPSIEKLNGVLTIVANRKGQLQDAIKRLNKYAMSLGESVSSGPFFNAYVANLLPGQFVQPFIDAAFSDLGLDPAVKLPSELVDPQTGQPGTPALPAPFPRTGQGGPPRMNLPDAITGNPGDPRYPYREPPPAPEPGGPPPGPPAPPTTDPHSSPPPPNRTPVYAPAPDDVPPQVTP